MVDVQQRLKAIWEFLGNEFPVSRDADPAGEHEIHSKRFEDLDDDIQEQLQGYELNIVELEESEDQEIQEMFTRLQNGVPLNAAERRNAISGAVRDFVSHIANQDLDEDEMDPEMREYQRAILQGTLSLTSQNVRRDFLMKDLLASMPTLNALDEQRQFTHEQRLVIYRKSNGKCINPNDNSDCVGDCTWDNFQADHIIPYSAGGKTAVDNGQLLCPSCNLKKSDTQ